MQSCWQKAHCSTQLECPAKAAPLSSWLTDAQLLQKTFTDLCAAFKMQCQANGISTAGARSCGPLDCSTPPPLPRLRCAAPGQHDVMTLSWSISGTDAGKASASACKMHTFSSGRLGAMQEGPTSPCSDLSPIMDQHHTQCRRQQGGIIAVKAGIG